MQISQRARTLVDRLNRRYLRCDMADSFMPHATEALIELEKTRDISGACMDSVARVVDALAARSSGVLETNHGGQYLLHLWGRSCALDRLLGGPLRVEARFALIELATLACVERSWQGTPPPGFAPLQAPWWTLLNAVVETATPGDSPARRWQDIIAHVRRAAVDGAPQNLACALAWCGMVDVGGDELIDDDFAHAACKERRWFTVSRGFGLRLLGQVFLIWDGVLAPPREQRGAS